MVGECWVCIITKDVWGLGVDVQRFLCVGMGCGVMGSWFACLNSCLLAILILEQWNRRFVSMCPGNWGRKAPPMVFHSHYGLRPNSVVCFFVLFALIYRNSGPFWEGLRWPEFFKALGVVI